MILKSLSRMRLSLVPWRALTVAGLLLAATPVAQSDPLIITRAMTATTIAEFFVEGDSVLVELEIGLADLPAFRNMLPAELLERLEGSTSPMAERLTRFFRDDLTITTSSGTPLPGKLLSLSARPRIMRDEVTGNPLPNQDEAAEMVLVATASYPLSGRPDTLVFSPPGLGILAWVTLAYRSRQGWSPGRMATAGVAGAVLLLGGAGAAFRQPVSSADAAPILGTLLTNMYRAFDYREEDRIYDTLARSAEGDLLTDVYLEMRRSLELANQGGARAKVTEVEVLEADLTPLDDGPGFASHAKWNVSGSVGHWGHTHIRTNQYEARFTVRAVDGAWKITGMEVLQEERL